MDGQNTVNMEYITIAGMILGFIWAFFKGSDLYGKYVKGRLQKSVDAIEAGVGEVYQTYVQEIKLASADGKLTLEEQATARAKAKECAYKFAKDHGIDLAKTIGEDFLNLWIERSVQKAKGQSK